MLHYGKTYSIVNIQRKAAGDYTCTAWNGVGEKDNATATVAVHCELRFAFFIMICVLAVIGDCHFGSLGTSTYHQIISVLEAS